MKEIRFFYTPDIASSDALPDAEAAHAVSALRLKEGDEIMLMDGIGTFYKAVITLSTKKRCTFEVIETLPQNKDWKGHIHLAIAPTKSIDRIEWMIEKATEAGVDEITFIKSKNSERTKINLERIKRIVISAAKQSRKPFMPIINETTDFDKLIKQQAHSAQVFIAHCYIEFPKRPLISLLEERPDTPTTILIGPEGDFSTDELQKAQAEGCISIDLGSSRLRTETAGLYAVMLYQTFAWRKRITADNE